MITTSMFQKKVKNYCTCSVEVQECRLAFCILGVACIGHYTADSGYLSDVVLGLSGGQLLVSVRRDEQGAGK